MDTERRKQLISEYRSRKPEMGVISLRCKETGQVFLGTATDTRAAFNSIRAKLSMGYHPNRALLELWKKYGEEGFEFSLVKALKYEDPLEDHSEELEELREKCLEELPGSVKIWK